MRQETLRRLISFGLLIVLLLIFSLTSSYFFTASNIITMLRENAPIGILAIGVTLAIISGGNDLSGGALLGMISMVCANLLYHTEVNSVIVVMFALILGVLCGALNGFLVSILRMPDFIATLSSSFVFRGLALVFAIRNETGMITNKVITDNLILTFGGSINGIYLSIMAFAIMVILGQFLLKRTRFGVAVYAIGTNRNSAELSGISFVKTKMGVFILSGLCASISSLFLMGRIRSVTPETGTNFEFEAISAVVIGGCAFSGGRGDMIGTLIGVLFMTVLENGLYKYDISTAFQSIINGGIIAIMLIFDAVYNEYMHNKLEKASVIAKEQKGGAH